MEIKGVYTALVTPVIGGKVNQGAIEKLVDHVINNGCKGLVVLGGTGEYCALTTEQRVDAVKMTISANKGRVPVVAGIIGPGLAEAIEMGEKSKKLGVDAVMVVTPYYVIANQQGIIDYYKAFMRAVDIPLVLYNIPYRTSVNMLPETVERLVDEDRAGKIVGIKECTPNMGQALELLHRIKDRISFISGEEYLFFTEIACGGSGAILASSNLIPKIWSELFCKIKNGEMNEAAVVFMRIIPLLKQIFAESNPGPLKHAMKMIGIDCGCALNPLTEVSENTIGGLKKELNELLEWYK